MDIPDFLFVPVPLEDSFFVLVPPKSLNPGNIEYLCWLQKGMPSGF